MDWSLLGFRGLAEVINVHPVFVHFPIALFPVTFLFYGIGVVWKKEIFILSGRFLLILAVLSTVITVLTGELAEETFSHNKTIHNMIMTHEKIGIAVLILGGILLLWSFLIHDGLPKSPRLFLITIGFTALLVLQNADIGGRMVFVEGAAIKPMIPQHNHEHHDHSHSEERPAH